MQILIGVVTHYYNHIGVAVLDVSGDLQVGDTVLFLGHTTDFNQTVSSMEIEHQRVQSVQAGMEVAVKVVGEVRRGDRVYKITDNG
jgi:putative protease